MVSTIYDLFIKFEKTLFIRRLFLFSRICTIISETPPLRQPLEALTCGLHRLSYYKYMAQIAIYPGSFDPLTNGHLDVIERAAALFEKVVVAIAHQSDKDSLFTIEEKVKMAREAVKALKNVEVDDFDKLLVDYVKAKQAKVIIRGLRAVSDFEYEFQMALMNRTLAPGIETIFMMPKETYSYLSSRITKQIASLGGNIEPFVPPHVVEALRKKFNNEN
jgi:pantetheine-phosphate adenylyltransferase